MDESIVLELTPGRMEEGGRLRHEHEVYFTLNAAHRAFFGARDIWVRTDDGDEFLARLSGNCGRHRPETWKNLRSVPSTKFGGWLKGRKQAVVGDSVRVTGLGDGTFLCEHIAAVSAAARRWAA